MMLARRHERGRTLLEFAVAGAIFAVLVGMLLNRLQFYRHEAELAAVRQQVAVLNVALELRIAHLLVSSKKADIAALIDDNPIKLLNAPPKNYLGEYYSPDTGTLPKGSWVFDRRDKTLLYLLNNSESFSANSPNLLKFKVRSVRLPSNTAKRPDPAPVADNVVLYQLSEDSGQLP